MHFFLSHWRYPKENTLPVYYTACEFVGTEFRWQINNPDQPECHRQFSLFVAGIGEESPKPIKSI